MAYQKPTFPYYWSIAATAASHWGKQMFDTLVKTQPWWSKLPFGWLSWMFIAFGAGLVAADCYNPRSWIRHNWREWNKVFEVQACFVNHAFVPNEFFEPVCLLKFKKNVRSAKLIVRVIQILHHENRIQVVHDEKITAPKDSERRLRLGSIPITHPGDPYARHALWGEVLGDKDLLPNQHSFIGGPVVIEVWVNRQVYRAFVSQMPQQIGTERPEFTLMNEADLEAFSNAKS